MSDDVDFATDLVQERLDQALAARLLMRSRVSGHSFSICTDCDSPIPEARQLAQPGCTLCLDCQQVEDARGARYAR
ncbi:MULTISPECIES: TraR/DksA family transcriptional regulator [unclassified Pseudomonas]|uniref:TraR/DksA family transcriptional regulator n=1 Tax=unclassified Pseudomonas TaxID=196821 RepID=UPI0009F5F341|nr:MULTISPECIES: TraR/DksA family transcriptional regulator [unclassified Pseudomonas]QIH09281.1 TraR/DksA family transcriptional regulator [Pseudomonas sp. BIOMIG1BAC]